MRLYLSRKGASVVTARLCKAHTAANCSYVIVLDPDTDGLESVSIVCARGRKNDAEKVGLGGRNAEEFVRTDDEGTNVERGAVVGGYPIRVNVNYRANSLDEHLLGKLGNAKTLVGRVSAASVHLRTEKADLAVNAAVSLKSLEHLLTVVEYHAGGGQLDIVEGLDSGIVPTLALGVVHHEHMIGKYLAKAKCLTLCRLCLGGSGSCDLDFHSFFSLF